MTRPSRSTVPTQSSSIHTKEPAVALRMNAQGMKTLRFRSHLRSGVATRGGQGRNTHSLGSVNDMGSWLEAGNMGQEAPAVALRAPKSFRQESGESGTEWRAKPSRHPSGLQRGGSAFSALFVVTKGRPADSVTRTLPSLVSAAGPVNGSGQPVRSHGAGGTAQTVREASSRRLDRGGAAHPSARTTAWPSATTSSPAGQVIATMRTALCSLPRTTWTNPTTPNSATKSSPRLKVA
jgi:hypothetical protein